MKLGFFKGSPLFKDLDGVLKLFMVLYLDVFVSVLGILGISVTCVVDEVTTGSEELECSCCILEDLSVVSDAGVFAFSKALDGIKNVDGCPWKGPRGQRFFSVGGGGEKGIGKLKRTLV